ncbi:protein GRAVITROPIC IN THE LIGHT 1 isoform X2 [Helianthus annuus]|nr:protein GRAVITROPIC IN THE LIGHT 1 isoform X2 [Helianthus annuus]XP_021989369.1 protein GRAVITROPIC IN THE LIGHT 1 isoform X2 [Helianthus annuus]
MDPINQSTMTPRKSKLARTFAKVLHIRAATNLDKLQKAKTFEKPNQDKPNINENIHFHQDIEKLQYRAAMDALIAKLFATISSVKATYAGLQYSQSPYDPEGIQSADQIIISELKRLSELKQSYLKKNLDYPLSETTLLLAELQEQKNLVKTYDITKKKLVDQRRSKESETALLKQKLEEMERENKLIERRLNSSGPLSRQENLQFSKLTPTDFVAFLKHATKSVRTFVKLMVTEMEFANWDIPSAAASIHPDAVYWNETHICFTFESFVCREMFNGFAHPSFSTSGERKTVKRQQLFFDRFMELKYLRPREYVTWKPTSSFARFCYNKYLQLVHPKMEMSLFGNLNQRNLVSVGKFPETTFFEAFAEVAKRVWLLHCLAFATDQTGASVFQVKKGGRFSEVFMESVNEEAFLSPESDRTVEFTVVPGFKLGKSVVQCQVYVS